VEDTGDIMQGLALADDPTRGIDDRDFGFRRCAMAAYVRIDMRAVDRLAIGRRCKIAGAAPGGQPARLDATFQVDYGDIVADAIGGLERCSVCDDGVRFESRFERASHLQRRGVDR